METYKGSSAVRLLGAVKTKEVLLYDCVYLDDIRARPKSVSIGES